MKDLDWYMSQIGRYKLLTREDEIRLARKARNGDINARQRMINSNLRLVIKIVQEYNGYQVSAADLIQEGNKGLIRAIDKYNPDLGYRVSTYAVWWIRSMIKAYLISSHSLVRIGTTHNQKMLFFSLRSTREKLTVDGQEPTLDELARALSVKRREVEEMNARLGGDLSSSRNVVEEARDTFIDVMPGEGNPQDDYSKTERNILVRTELWRAMHDLNEKERYIIFNRLLSNEPMTLKKIAARFSLSRQRIQQIEKNALRKLRDIFEATDLRPERWTSAA